MTTIITDLKQNSEFAARQWELYKKAVQRIGDTKSLREANEGIGYNLVKTIPGLLRWIHELEEANLKLRQELVTKVNGAKGQKVDKTVEDKRPLGIPDEHIVLNVTGSVDLVVEDEGVPFSDGDMDQEVSAMYDAILHDSGKRGKI